MQVGEILLAEALPDEQGHGEGVAEGEGGGGAGRRHEVQGARLGADAAVEGDVGAAREGRPGGAGQADEPGPDPPDGVDQAQDLVRLAAVRQGHHDVVVLHDAEVAVDRLGRMQEERRGAGAGEGGRDLAADDPGLAHAGDDDPPRAGVEQADRGVEPVVESVRQGAHRGRLGLDDLPRQLPVDRRPAGVHGPARRRLAAPLGALPVDRRPAGVHGVESPGVLAASAIRSTRSSSGWSRSSRSAFWASLFARAGSS